MRTSLYLRITLLLLVLLATGMLAAASGAKTPLRESGPPRAHLQRVPMRPDLRVGDAVPAPQPLTATAVEIASFNQLVFQSFPKDNWDIYMADADGANRRRLTEFPGPDMEPDLNRGCSRVAFSSLRGGNLDIFTMDPDGTHEARLTEHSADDGSPAWSPDGSRIAFESYRDGQGEVYVMNADGSAPTRLTDHPEYDGLPAWSPDGTRIAFTSWRSGGYRIWVMSADGSNPVRLSQQAYSEAPAWSPDGLQIAYDADGNGDGTQELWLMNADGSDQHEIVEPGGANTDVWAGNWSAEGQYLSFTRVQRVLIEGEWYLSAVSLEAWDSSLGWIFPLTGTTRDMLPAWASTDNLAPSSRVHPLPAEIPWQTAVSWSGEDSGGSELANFDVQFRDGAGGVWTDWYRTTYETLSDFWGVGGHTYYFRSRARDRAWNVEPWPAEPDTFTSVEALPPVTRMQPLPPYSRDGIVLAWEGHDPGGSGIAHYDLQVRDAAIGTWADLESDLETTQYWFDGTPGTTYQFRVRATDFAQNEEPWPPGDGDASTTFYRWSVSGWVHDNAQAPVVGAVVTTTPAAFETHHSDGEGQFASYVAQSSNTYTVSVSKPGYGSLPPFVYAGPSDIATLVVTLPPADDVIVDGGFENGTLDGGPWQAGGRMPPEVTDRKAHSGRYAARLGPAPSGVVVAAPSALPGSATAQRPGQAALSTLSQTFTVPASETHPRLSFLYELWGTYGDESNRLSGQLDDGTAITTLFSTTVPTWTWSLASYDLAPWAGQTVTLSFTLEESAGGTQATAYLDEVSAGSAYPDLWVRQRATPTAALPGTPVLFYVTYGNQGGAPAYGVRLTETLPAGLNFVGASLPTSPRTALPAWEWALGDLPAQSGPHTILITATVAPTAPHFGTLTNTLRLGGTGAELEIANNVATAAVTVAQRLYLPMLVKNVDDG